MWVPMQWREPHDQHGRISGHRAWRRETCCENVLKLFLWLQDIFAFKKCLLQGCAEIIMFCNFFFINDTYCLERFHKTELFKKNNLACKIHENQLPDVYMTFALLFGRLDLVQINCNVIDVCLFISILGCVSSRCRWRRRRTSPLLAAISAPGDCDLL